MKERLTDAAIEEHLRKAIDDATPDILESLMDEIQNEPPARLPEAAEADGAVDGAVNAATDEGMLRRIHTRRRWYRAIASCAAALMILLGGLTLYQKSQKEAFALVGIDVNPSVELSVDHERVVRDAKALNDDGTVVLEDMDLKGLDLNTACNALAGSMLKHGYLSDQSGSVMISVRSEDETWGHEVEKIVSGEMSGYLENANLSGAVLGQYIGSSGELDAFAREHDISPGKAWLIKNLMTTQSRHMTEEALLKLSTQELILLSQERDVAIDDIYGDADKSRYISKDDAVKIALDAAGVAGAGQKIREVAFDCDDGIITYEVDFVAGGREYEYDINAETGEVIESEVGDLDDDDDLDADDGDNDEALDDGAEDFDDDADDRYDDDADSGRDDGDYDDDADDGRGGDHDDSDDHDDDDRGGDDDDDDDGEEDDD